jgi:RimJ/RimL family protein N-acetyltransferase
VLSLHEMQVNDLPRVRRWLSTPHVARWYLAGSSVERELGDLRRSVTGLQPVHALIVLDDGEPIGWCQWYLCGDDPGWAADVGAEPGDVGVDYAIGDPTKVTQGLGTALVGALVKLVRGARPDCGVVADPEEGNVASRRVLEKNGFQLIAVRPIPSELTDGPMAIYRLPPPITPAARVSA